MQKSGIGYIREVNRELLGDFKIQEDVKMYMQLPDYDDLRGLDLPGETDLTGISKRIYGGFGKPSWLTLKRHLFRPHIQTQLFKAISEICIQDKKAEFKKERLFRRVSKIHLSRTSNGVMEMDFVEDGGDATFPHLQDTFSRYSAISLIGTGEEKEQTTEKAARDVLPNWVSFFGTPDISLADKDSMFTRVGFSRFCNGGDFALRAVIPRRLQSLRATGRRHRYFKETPQQIKDNRKIRQIRPLDRQGYDALIALRLNSQV